MERYEPPARPARPLFANDSTTAVTTAPMQPVRLLYGSVTPTQPANDLAGERLVMARLYSGQGSLPGLPATPQPRQAAERSHGPARQAGLRYYTEAVYGAAGHVNGVSLHDRQRDGQRLRLFTFAEYGRGIAIARAANLCEALNLEHAAAVRNRARGLS